MAGIRGSSSGDRSETAEVVWGYSYEPRNRLDERWLDGYAPGWRNGA